ncbi:MAG: NADH-quinone oxidoreductase subunit M [Paenibacillus sp. RIFOXYA1_FULL_44_5]|nr:MAG: NADH-quinone oxidoreductase subunit M [Paenibacillus sp. RIFOXYA1_FULL_44_5]
MANYLLSLITFSPLLGVLVILFMPKEKGRAIRIVAVVTTLIPLVLSAIMYVTFNQHLGTMQFKENVPWIHIPLNKEGLNNVGSYFFEIRYNLAVDGLSLPLVFLTALVSTMAALASMYIKKRWKTYYILFLLLESGMFGVFMAQDLFLFFMFFEITLVPTFFLIGIWGYMQRERAANKFLIYNGIGSAIMLIAFLIMINTAGFTVMQESGKTLLYYSGDIQQIMHNLMDKAAQVNQVYQNNSNPFFMSAYMKGIIFALLIVAFGIKLPIFPFHTWMLKVHTEAPPSVVMIHSGILLKMGAYGLLRFGILVFPQEAKNWAVVLAILGLINILYGAILALRQNEFKLVLAYSSISHMGVVLLGLAAFNVIGLQGAIFQLVSHGLISALFFLIVGILYERTGTTELDRLGGLAKSMPFTGGVLMLTGMASLGLPLLSGFISEFLSFLGLYDSMPVVTIVGTLGIIFTAVYVLRGVMRITFGPIQEKFQEIRDARFSEALPMITLAAFIILIGIYPAVLNEPMQQTVNGFNQFIHDVVKNVKMGG